MPEPKNRARIEILSHLAQFSLARRYGDHVYGGLPDMAFQGGREQEARPGDLVAIQSAPPSKWYLGWLVERARPSPGACEVFTIESLEDGELCNWSNVGIIFYDRSQVESHPNWRWTDAQYAFQDRWFKVCYKDRDAYIYLPVFSRFDGDAVELAVRVRHGFSGTVIRRTFGNWRKVTKKIMLEFYDAAKAELEAERPRAANG